MLAGRRHEVHQYDIGDMSRGKSGDDYRRRRRGKQTEEGEEGVKLACRENIAGRDFDGELGGRAAPSLSMGKIG